jgi:hypothetical protein
MGTRDPCLPAGRQKVKKTENETKNYEEFMKTVGAIHNLLSREYKINSRLIDKKT